MADWPWSDLGIRETADKEAIREAFALRRAALGAGLPISAYAGLTEAREKALFLASEMQRESQRADRAATSETPTGSASPPEDRNASHSFGLSAPTRPSSDPNSRNSVILKRLSFDEPEDRPATYVDPSYREETEGAHAYRRTQIADERIEFREALASVRAFAKAQFHAHTSREQRIWLKRIWPLGILAFLAFTVVSAREDEPVTKLVAQPVAEHCINEGEKTLCFEDTFVSSSQLPSGAHLDELTAEIFGPDVSADSVARINPQFYQYMRTVFAREGVDGMRAELRREALRWRDRLPVGDVIAINRLYLDWLRTSRAAGGSQCLEVATWAFFDGVPAMEEQAIVRERAVMKRLLHNAGVGVRPEIYGRFLLPDDIAARAGEPLGFTGPQAASALKDAADPANCDVRIELLKIMLDDPSAVSRDLFRRL